MRYWLVALCFLCGPLAVGLAAGESRAVDGRPASPHEHGTSALGIAVAGQGLRLELSGPAGNFTRTEHPPATPEGTRELARVLDVLRDGAALFLTPPEAHCRLRSAAVSPPAYGADGHAGLAASWDFQCGSPAALTWLEARVFTAFPATERLGTRVVSGAAQKAVVLTPGTPRVLLPR